MAAVLTVHSLGWQKSMLCLYVFLRQCVAEAMYQEVISADDAAIPYFNI